ncbi:T9SS type A sorting domain-containing protein [Saccharicrinis sp. FJH54]|uniref:T9SS type A sorting domain-containing protein n=1 Tax=Saccharicrinis sp. FJH54 TaxID=3344665 RepID=UPI0035D40AA2
MKTRSLLTFVTVFLFSVVNAQETIVPVGSNATGSGGSASYSIGQMVYKTKSSSDYSLSEGVQQPFEISVLTKNNELLENDIELKVFPNPATDLVTLSLKENDIKDLTYKLYNLKGKLLQSKIITGTTNISFKELSPSTYLLKVIVKEEEYMTFKIIKIK